MPRRAHRKSRNGCIECKRRRIKCDESRPICSNCICSERSCQYAEGESGNRRPDHSPSQPTTSPAVSSIRASPALPSVQASNQEFLEDLENECPPVNMQHVELFYHLCTETLQSLQSDFEGREASFSEILKEVVPAPYLMNELLALAAIHLSTMRPAKQEFYRRQATELQTHALSIFNRINPEINTETCVPVFFFSSVLGLHVMCETFYFCETDFEKFLEEFVHYLSLHQGVRAVTRETWHILNESALKPFLKQGESILPSGEDPGYVCSRLTDLVKTADISQESIVSCEQAISALQLVFSAAHSNKQERPSFSAIVSWPVILCPGYTGLLRQREPHALIILAHYAALVHSRHDLWICGDGGRFLVEMICQYLGSEWSDWLTWPKQALEDPKVAIARA